MMNHRYNRRRFIGAAGAGIAGVVGAPWLGKAAAAEGDVPDLVVFNAKVYTVDPGMPKAEAFAVKASKFVAVGRTEDIKASDRQRHPDLRRKANDDRARVHRLPQSCARRHIAL